MILARQLSTVEGAAALDLHSLTTDRDLGNIKYLKFSRHLSTFRTDDDVRIVEILTMVRPVPAPTTGLAYIHVAKGV